VSDAARFRSVIVGAGRQGTTAAYDLARFGQAEHVGDRTQREVGLTPPGARADQRVKGRR
jgi:thioredoxin reductase